MTRLLHDRKSLHRQGLLVFLQRPKAIDKELVTDKLIQVIAMSNLILSEIPQARTQEAMEAETPPPPVPCATYGRRLALKTGKCARSASYKLPHSQSLAHPTSFAPLGEPARQV